MVAVPVPLRRTFTYAVPEHLRPGLRRGARVRVPLGRRRVHGTVVEWPVAAPAVEVEAKDVDAVLDRGPALSDEILDLTRFVSEYYLCAWGEAIEAALPPEVAPAVPARVVRRAPAVPDPPARASARRRAWEALPADGTAIPLDALPTEIRRSLQELVRLGAAQLADAADLAPAEQVPSPRPRRSAVLGEVEVALGRRAFAPFVLFGATGSGKTEVYLRAAEATLSAGRSVLYMVPEIGLTPLLVKRLASRFPGRVAVLHSGLAAGERRAAWERVRSGACRFVVGTRSAVFAPLADLGLVVVDEEHDPSYKQGESPRYHGRDLAVVRGREAQAVVLLGSATPSLESFAHARSGRYGLLRLGGRLGARPLAAVEVVDMRREFLQTGAARPLSRALVSALQECLGRGEQALVLRNRRGWAVSLLCPACGTRVTCPRCSLALTWHQAAARLRCHLCDLERPHPGECPSCRFEELQQVGEGAERIEHELRLALPAARMARMDRDTVRRKGAQEDLLQRFAAGEIDVLVGTQMIAKGHDFPRVTLVGVVSADQSLGLPDFRAGERTFQLLTQVAGRAGRGDLPGRVVVQAFDPEHPVLREAARQDFEAFFTREMAYRRALRYPPLTALVQVIVSDKDPVQADLHAEEVGRALRAEGKGRLLVTGPGPAPVERARTLWRRQIFVRSTGRRRLVAAVAQALAALEGKVPARAMTVDVDPLSIL